MRAPTRLIKPGFKCLEIGVWRGDYSAEILQQKPGELHLVDPWAFQPEFGRKWYGGMKAKQQQDMDAVYDSVVARFKEELCFGVQIHRGFATELSKIFQDEYFDWIYIDGNHEYDYVLQDLQNYKSKVKKGGFLTGDDYTWKNDEGILTVKKAVELFVKTENLKLETHGSQFIIRL